MAGEVIKYLKKGTNACTEDERNTLFAFVRIALGALNKLFYSPMDVKTAFLIVSPSDIAWGVANFRYYSKVDTPLSAEEIEAQKNKKTKKGNDYQRRNQRVRLASKKEVKNQIGQYWQEVWMELRSWEAGIETDRSDEEREEKRVERRKIREAWATKLEELYKDAFCSGRENVVPANGSSGVAKKQAPAFIIDLDLIPTATAAV